MCSLGILAVVIWICHCSYADSVQEQPYERERIAGLFAIFVFKSWMTGNTSCRPFTAQLRETEYGDLIVYDNLGHRCGKVHLSESLWLSVRTFKPLYKIRVHLDCCRTYRVDSSLHLDRFDMYLLLYVSVEFSLRSLDIFFITRKRNTVVVRVCMARQWTMYLTRKFQSWYRKSSDVHQYFTCFAMSKCHSWSFWGPNYLLGHWLHLFSKRLGKKLPLQTVLI